MAVQLDISYETLLALVAQLTDEQRRDLMSRLQQRTRRNHARLPDNKLSLFRAAQIHAPVNEEPSPRREDWYDDGDR